MKMLEMHFAVRLGDEVNDGNAVIGSEAVIDGDSVKSSLLFIPGEAVIYGLGVIDGNRFRDVVADSVFEAVILGDILSDGRARGAVQASDVVLDGDCLADREGMALINIEVSEVSDSEAAAVVLVDVATEFQVVNVGVAVTTVEEDWDGLLKKGLLTRAF